MFLNQFTQAVAFYNNKEELCQKYESDDYNGPLLLCSTACSPIEMPNNWNGIAYGTEEILESYKNYFSHLDKPPQIEYIALQPCEPIFIAQRTDLAELTVIPAGKDAEGNKVAIFILKTDYISVLLTNELSFGLDWLSQEGGDCFYKTLEDGCDIMYINDKLYIDMDKDESLACEQLEQHQRLHVLVQLIQPKQLVGLTRVPLPMSLTNLCAKKDIYENVHFEPTMQL